MRSVLFAIATVAVVLLFNIGMAQAQDYPFCVRNGGGPGDCKYDTYQQCLAAISGTGGECQPNYWLPQRNAAPPAGRSMRANRTYGRPY